MDRTYQSAKGQIFFNELTIGATGTVQLEPSLAFLKLCVQEPDPSKHIYVQKVRGFKSKRY